LYRYVVVPGLPGAATAESESDAEGKFSLAGVPKGAWKLSVSAAGHETFVEDSFVVNANAEGAEFHLDLITYVLSGTVGNAEVGGCTS
jgi:hypothetical protein